MKDYIIKKKTVIEGRNFKIAFAGERKLLKTERTRGSVC